ncbi:MAG: adenylate/guanylate cyclase domain-containing protein [Planctomycetota bacterium]|jgi:adenylate cyclase
MAKIQIIEGSNAGETFMLDHDSTLGRSMKNKISLLDGRASRHHARIFKDGSDYYIQDLNSANGTFLNKKQLPPEQSFMLSHEDEIKISSSVIKYIKEDEEESSIFSEFDGLSVRVAGDEKGESSPSVNLSLDASLSMVAVRPEEQSSEGLHDAVKRLQAMCQVSIALGSVTDSEQVMNKIIDCIFDIFPHAERAFVMLSDKNNRMMPVAARSRNQRVEKEEIAVSKSIINEVVTNKRSILSNDAMSDDRFSNQMSIVNFSIRSMMCAPLLVDEEILGLIQVDTASGVQSFSEEDLQILTGITAQAAVAVKNVQLYEEVETETARRTSLQRYFSPNMVELMMSDEMGTELGGKRYRGTVFFSDIIGFTAMSETMPPEQVVTNLNRYFTIMQKLIYDNGGNVDKFGGDAIMAFWSVPQHSQGDEARAITTGLQMQNSQWDFNRCLVAEGERPIYMGVGINSGEFVAGNVGSEDKIEFTLIGDNVNLAARIESHAGRGQVFIAESTYQIVKEDVIAVELPPVMLKGKSMAATIYSVKGVNLGSGDYLLSLPCDILSNAGVVIAEGIITAMAGSGADRRVMFNTASRLAEGDTLGLRLKVREYSEPVGFIGNIEGVSTVTGVADHPYFRVVLNSIKESSSSGILKAGSCLKSGLTWDHLRRQ